MFEGVEGLEQGKRDVLPPISVTLPVTVEEWDGGKRKKFRAKPSFINISTFKIEKVSKMFKLTLIPGQVEYVVSGAGHGDILVSLILKA